MPLLSMSRFCLFINCLLNYYSSWSFFVPFIDEVLIDQQDVHMKSFLTFRVNSIALYLLSPAFCHLSKFKQFLAYLSILLHFELVNSCCSLFVKSALISFFYTLKAAIALSSTSNISQTQRRISRQEAHQLPSKYSQ